MYTGHGAYLSSMKEQGKSISFVVQSNQGSIGMPPSYSVADTGRGSTNDESPNGKDNIIIMLEATYNASGESFCVVLSTYK